MPRLKSRKRSLGRCPEGVTIRPAGRRISRSRCKLDPSTRVIAPAHSFTLPSLKGVQDRFEFSCGFEAALQPVRALIQMGLLRKRHLQNAKSPVAVLERFLSEIVKKHFSGPRDEFDIVLSIADRLEDHHPIENVLFFVWSNSIDPQYIPLRPIFERLEGNAHREPLMASLYQWLYRASSRVFDAFGLDEARNVYGYRQEYYKEAMENGEDVDLEGEVEYADPGKVVSYIRDSEKLALQGAKAHAAISSIVDDKLRPAFAKAHRMFLNSRRIQFPRMSKECTGILDDAAYYMDASPMPGLGISHWRDDPIVAWFDEYCQEQFESGATCRAPIILCIRPDDTASFAQIVKTLPKLIQIADGLSEWVRFGQEMENASEHGNR